MNGKIIKIFISLILITSLTSFISPNEKVKKDIHFFIEKAWINNSSIKQAQFDIKKYKYLELEAWSVYTPKIDGMTWIAPMYTIKQTSDPYKTTVDYNSWGPYYHLDLLFQQPIFAFTRVISGIKAAREGQAVAKADVEITKWEVAKKIRTYYYGILFASTLLKTIDMAEDTLNSALDKVKEAKASGNSDVSEVDEFKLQYYSRQIPTYRSFAKKSLKMAKEALLLETGETIDASDIPHRLTMEDFDFKSLQEYSKIMFANRPLYSKLLHGINATTDLMLLEYKSMIPVLFAGGYLKYNIAPTVDFHSNMFLSKDYNTFSGNGDRGVDFGFAFGLLWKFDPMKSIAKALQKKAELDKLHELLNYANQGFPVELKKVISDLNDLKVKIKNNKKAINDAQSWMFFAANAYAIGEGKAQDMMEGLAAYIKSKLDYYQAIYDYNQLLGDFCEIVGVDVTTLKDDNHQ